MRCNLFSPVLLAITALAVPVPNQNDVIGDAGVAVNVGGDKTVGVLDHKRDVIGDLGLAANVGGDKTVGVLDHKRDGGHGGDDSGSDVIGKLGAAVNVGGADTIGAAR
ncbi:hypothetical protein N7537_005143 [Penicillium hordei]|uniref:Uncharacterized protein n=1 Tax=Penicillium hordei TaxID=40994 RepID=A0AAD6ED25_9EURO|nr:uncharacterized protein N7537_005143 [Penicillium hordei]KAJ5608524.1 hypothetical protein N7537_005143 [Penicillium hordei]